MFTASVLDFAVSEKSFEELWVAPDKTTVFDEITDILVFWLFSTGKLETTAFDGICKFVWGETSSTLFLTVSALKLPWDEFIYPLLWAEVLWAVMGAIFCPLFTPCPVDCGKIVW